MVQTEDTLMIHHSSTPLHTTPSWNHTSSSLSTPESSSKILVDQFHAKYMDAVVYFTILKFSAAMYIWIGEQHAVMSNLSMGLFLLGNQQYSHSPSSTKLFGSMNHDFSTLMANRLAKRFPETQVFVSYVLDETVDCQCYWAQRQVMEKLTQSGLDPCEESYTRPIEK